MSGDPRWCAWLGCGHPACETTCKPVSVTEWRRWHDEVEAACEVMHDAYEAAAPRAGWRTQRASRKPWADVPEANKATMRAAVKALLAWQYQEDDYEYTSADVKPHRPDTVPRWWRRKRDYPPASSAPTDTEPSA